MATSRNILLGGQGVCLCGKCVVVPVKVPPRLVVRVGTRTVQAIMSPELPASGWRISAQSYVQYTSTNKRWPYLLWKTAQAATMLLLGGGPENWRHGWHVHHMDWNKLNNCPLNLCWMQPQFNTVGNAMLRCPYTGRYITKDEYERTFGH